MNSQTEELSSMVNEFDLSQKQTKKAHANTLMDKANFGHFASDTKVMAAGVKSGAHAGVKSSGSNGGSQKVKLMDRGAKLDEVIPMEPEEFKGF
ncbi:MAG: hypothetical protein HGA76_09380 [Candidatus Firestonebacteria bacterium]|nr:hypothetical protein [Candidatus Firestonebacteria bacterium]